MKWRVVKLDEIKAPEKGALVSGPFGSNIGSRFFVATGVPVIRGNNLSMGQKRFIDDGFVFITEDKARELRNCNARSDDIIFTAAGTLGQVGLMPKIGRFESYIISNKQIRLRLDTNQAFPLFAYYFLSSPDMRAFIASQNKGSSVPLLTLGIVRNLKIPLPPITTQKRIVAILSAYDELIENNQRRIALLEKMAEEIYREWFVRMRFPGHEKVKKVKGVPEGWRSSCLGNVAKFTMGQSPSSEFYNEVGDGLPFHQGVGTYGERFPRIVTYCSEDGRRAQKGDILFSVRAPVGRLNIAEREMIIGRGLAAVRHKKEHNSYMYYLLKTAFKDEDIIGNGSIFNSVGKDELAKFSIFEPEPNLVEKFDTLTAKMDEQIVMLMQATERLKSSRDLLLPRLIFGKLSVEHLDIQFPPGMEESTCV